MYCIASNCAYDNPNLLPHKVLLNRLQLGAASLILTGNHKYYLVEYAARTKQSL